MAKRIIQVEEKVPANLLIPLSIQHMFAMFGASVLVPFLFGINPAIVLFMNGIGTLLFIFIIETANLRSTATGAKRTKYLSQALSTTNSWALTLFSITITSLAMPLSQVSTAKKACLTCFSTVCHIFAYSVFTSSNSNVACCMSLSYYGVIRNGRLCNSGFLFPSG